VHLIYLDDGGKGAIKVFGGVVVDHSWFTLVEVQSALIVYQLLGNERRDQFKEFHASDLYNGEGVFEGIAEEKRHAAFQQLLDVRNMLRIAYVYSAIDTGALNRSPMRSASWMDIAFTMCACAIDEYIRKAHMTVWTQHSELPEEKRVGLKFPDTPFSLIIVDEPEQQRDKGRIRDSFRAMRKPLAHAIQQTSEGGPFTWSNRLVAPADEVLFGNSADSIGLQVADACNWVMWRHLSGDEAGNLYDELMNGVVICAKPEPEWTQYRHLFRAHD
jgi:Protein of unknown function (DUF3800)